MINTYHIRAVLHEIGTSPWISAKIRKLLKKRKRLHRNSKQARTENKESIKNKLRNLKHQIRKETRTAYWDYVETNIFPETSDEPNRSNKKTMVLHQTQKNRLGWSTPTEIQRNAMGQSKGQSRNLE